MQDASSDKELIARALRGEDAAFELLVERYKRYIFSIITRHVPYENVEEIAHETFVQVYFSLRAFRAESPLQHWLSTIAVRQCYEYYRKKKRSREIPESQLTEGTREWAEYAAAGEAVAAFEAEQRKYAAAEIVRLMRNVLSADEIIVVSLLYMEQQSVKEIARQLGWSETKVKVRAYRVKKQLRKLFTEWGL